MEKLNLNEMKQQILSDESLIFTKHPEEKYRREPIEKDIKFPIENFIDFQVYQKSKCKNIKLQTFLFTPDSQKHTEVKALVYLIHGMQGHSNQQAYVAKRLADIGCIVAAYDFRGHGLSEGSRGDIEDFKYLIEDTQKFMKETEKFLLNKYKGNTENDNNSNEDTKISFLKKKFIAGISMGGLLSFFLTKDSPYEFKGVIFFAPAFDMQKDCCTKFALKTFGCCIPCIPIPTDKSESVCYKNPYLFEHKDPLVENNIILMRTAKTMYDYMLRSQKLFSSYESPFIVVIPGVDKLVPPIVMYKLYEEAKSIDKDVVYCRNMWHCYYGEEEVFGIADKICDWVNERS